MAITPLPTPPSRSAPSTFSTLADAFIAALPVFVTEANAQAAALELNDTTDTSASSVAIGLGAKTFTVTAAKSFQPGMSLTIADTAAPSTNWMLGQVTSYSGTTLIMNITHIKGSGTKSAWVISFSAPIQSLGALAESINTAYATVASHATTSAIWAAAGNIINFTGAETITDFPAADQAGSQRFLICAAACVFTHAGNISVQGNATYTAVAGDVAIVTALSTTTFKVNILRQANNYMATDAIWDAAGDLVQGTGADTGEKMTSAAFSLFQRSQFTYFDADQITCGAGQYMCKDKVAYWVSTLTTNATGAAGGADWWYLYLDYSAITSNTAITASELIWSITEPAWNTTYRQWMNGDDRCIFAVRTDGSSNILEFFHNGDLCIFADKIMVTDAVDPGTTWTDSTQIIPIFTNQALVTIRARYVDTGTQANWRTNGQTGTAGHQIAAVDADSQEGVNTLPVITDSSGIIEFKYSDAGGNTFYIYTDGWYFPTGI